MCWGRGRDRRTGVPYGAVQPMASKACQRRKVSHGRSRLGHPVPSSLWPGPEGHQRRDESRLVTGHAGTSTHSAADSLAYTTGERSPCAA